MADPNPKRAKMDNPNGQSSSTSPKDRKIQLKLIDTSTQSFDKIRNMPGFVDHTHFIRRGLQKNLAIFAPRRFGKSTHLSMVLKFLQIDVDETTGEVSSSVNGPANGRKNYKLFEGTRIITDDNNKDLVEAHLGKHPVIHLDFKDASIDSFENAKMHCRRAVHKAYKNHSYLITSTKLVPGDEEENTSVQLLCKRWCDDEQYKEQDLRGSLVNLTNYLYEHFNSARVYILVDEFDAINASALRKIPKENSENDRVAKLEKIWGILGSLLGPVTKGCNDVAGAIFTGVSSHMSSLRYWSDFNNFTAMKFLDGQRIPGIDQDFVPFYGATKEEVESLIQKLVKNKELVMFEEKEEFLNDTNELDVKKIMDDVQSRYNCYFDSKGAHIFCLWSVLQYLESGDAINYWNQTDEIEDLYMILKCEKVAYKIIKLMRWEMIGFHRCHQMLRRSLVDLHDFLAMKNEDKSDPEDVFNFLMDQGYLTYPEGGEKDLEFRNFKLPNAEIRAALSNMMRKIVESHWEIVTTSCTRLINDISLSLMKDEKALQNMMLEVYEAICSILKGPEKTDRALVNESRMLCIMYKALNDAKSFELCGDLQIKDAEGRLITLDSSEFLMHKNDEKCSILWELKYNDSEKDKYTTSLHALQEARGIVTPKYGKIKDYMDPILKKLGREALVIGLSMDSDIKVSLSYALGMEKKIFYKSETESTSFPDLYKTYNPASLPLEKNHD